MSNNNGVQGFQMFNGHDTRSTPVNYSQAASMHHRVYTPPQTPQAPSHGQPTIGGQQQSFNANGTTYKLPMQNSSGGPTFSEPDHANLPINNLNGGTFNHPGHVNLNPQFYIQHNQTAHPQTHYGFGNQQSGNHHAWNPAMANQTGPNTTYPPQYSQMPTHQAYQQPRFPGQFHGPSNQYLSPVGNPNPAVSPQSTAVGPPPQAFSPPNTAPLTSQDFQEHVNQLLREKGSEFRGHIRSQADLARFEQAVRASKGKTIKAEQVEDKSFGYPSDDSGRLFLVQRLFSAFFNFDGEQDPVSDLADNMNCYAYKAVRQTSPIEGEILAYKLIDAMLNVQRGLHTGEKVKQEEDYMAKVDQVVEALSLNKLLCRSAISMTGDWIARIAADPAGERDLKNDNVKNNNLKKKVLQQDAVKRGKARRAHGTGKSGGKGKGKNKRQATPEEEEEEEEEQQHEAGVEDCITVRNSPAAA